MWRNRWYFYVVEDDIIVIMYFILSVKEERELVFHRTPKSERKRKR